MDLKRTFFSKIKKSKDSMTEQLKAKVDNKNQNTKLLNTDKSYYKKIRNKMRHFNNKNKDFRYIYYLIQKSTAYLLENLKSDHAAALRLQTSKQN